MARSNLYLTLAGQLEQLIFQTVPGSFLPSERELADRFHVSKPTLRRALKILISNGIISSKNGVGCTVLRRPEKISRELIFLCADLIFFADTLKIFSLECAKYNYFSSIVPYCGTQDVKQRILHTAAARHPAGIVLYTGQDFADLPIPPEIPVLHLIRRTCRNVPGDLLTFRNAEAVSETVRRFYKDGCRKFALYGRGSVNPAAAEERRNGFIDGLRKVRLKVRDNLIYTNEDEEDAGARFFSQFKQKTTCPDAVCCLNDYCAGQLMQELIRRNLPLDRLHISGFDAMDYTVFFPKPILTVNPPMEELGRRSVEMLIRKIENPGLADTSKILKSELLYSKQGV